MVRYKETKYLISSSGLIVNEATGKPIKPQDNGRGYKKVTLTTKGQPIQKYVHRLVAEHYCENPNGYKQVNHIDGDKSNNHFANLEWVNSLMNIRHAINSSLFPKTTEYWSSKLKEQQIRMIIKLSENGHSGVELAKKYKVSRSTISQIKNRKRHKKIIAITGEELTIKQ